MRAYDLGDWEGTFKLIRKLLYWPLCLKVPRVKPNRVSNGVLRGGLAMPISELLLACLGELHLFLKDLINPVHFLSE